MRTKQSAALESYLAQLLDPNATGTTKEASAVKAQPIDEDEHVLKRSQQQAKVAISIEKSSVESATNAPISVSENAYSPAVAPSLKQPENVPESVAPEPTVLSNPILKSHLDRLLSRVSEAAITPVVKVNTDEAAIMPASPKIIAKPPVEPVVHTPTMEDLVNSQQPDLPLTSIDEFREHLPESFQTLIFYVGKLQLAMPLHLLGGIVKKVDEPTPIFGSPPWFTGLLQTNTGSLQVIDTGMYLFNERYTPDLKDGYQYIIRIGESPWGLLVTELCTTKVLAHDEIRWFPNENGRPWIAGIVKEEKCALLNAPALMARFQNESQKKPAKVKKTTMLDKKSAPKSGAVARRHRSDDSQNH